MDNDLSFDEFNYSNKIAVDFLAIKIGATYFDNPYYSNETVIAFHTNKIPSSEFNQLVKRTDALASKSVECLSVREDCLCVCISDVSRGDIVE